MSSLSLNTKNRDNVARHSTNITLTKRSLWEFAIILSQWPEVTILQTPLIKKSLILLVKTRIITCFQCAHIMVTNFGFKNIVNCYLLKSGNFFEFFLSWVMNFPRFSHIFNLIFFLFTYIPNGMFSSLLNSSEFLRGQSINTFTNLLGYHLNDVIDTILQVQLGERSSITSTHVISESCIINSFFFLFTRA